MAARLITAFTAALLLASPNLWAQSQSDPPARVGRLSAIEGAVQQRTPDDNDWVQANLNYPVTSGFAIAPQDGGRAEIQVGSTALRVGPLSELDVTNLTEQETSLTLAQGELNVRVGQIPNGERIEIVTPRGVMEILAAGQYHLDAGTTENPTRFEVFDGRAQVQRDGGNTDLASGQAALINPDDSLSMASARPDPLDQWAFGRDRGPRSRTSIAGAPPPPPPSDATADYVSPEMTGAADLSAYGNWSPSPDYGEVWYPSGISADWAPYTDGHWAWVSPWGWTWIDDEPWGFAPFHYGRWAYIDGRWGWVPGEFVPEPVYAPALVTFFGGFDVGIGVGWCPLGPGELFVPGFSASVAFVRNVNITNVNINQFNITRVNNTIVVNNDPHWGGQVSNFANHRFATVVPANQFGQAQRARDVAIHNASVTNAAARLPVRRDPPVAAPRSAAGSNAPGNRAALFNRGGRPPLPQARTATGMRPGQPGTPQGRNAPTRTIAGHTLPALPPAHGNATPGSNVPSRLGAGTRTPGANANRGLPSVPTGRGAAPAFSGNRGPQDTTINNASRRLPPVPTGRGAAPAFNGNRGPHGATVNNAAPTGRTLRGPFGSSRPNATTGPTAPNVSSSSAGRGLSHVPPQPRTPTAPTGSVGHRGFTGPTPGFQQQHAAGPMRNFTPPARNFAPPARSIPHNAAAPSRSVSAPVHPQAPVHTAAPPRSFSPPARPAPTPRSAPAPHFAAPVHSAPPTAPARPVGNAAVSHAPAPRAQPAPHPGNNRKNQN